MVRSLSSKCIERSKRESIEYLFGARRGANLLNCPNLFSRHMNHFCARVTPCKAQAQRIIYQARDRETGSGQEFVIRNGLTSSPDALRSERTRLRHKTITIDLLPCIVMLYFISRENQKDGNHSFFNPLHPQDL